jgi:hypothetical protein
MNSGQEDGSIRFLKDASHSAYKAFCKIVKANRQSISAQIVQFCNKFNVPLSILFHNKGDLIEIVDKINQWLKDIYDFDGKNPPSFLE